MLEPLIVTAFLMGLLSAASLPLGTLTTLVWTPNDRAIGILMAFGGGALLAALTIDLVGSALERGHFNALAVGCVIGGVTFVALDAVVNSHGGFLRKSSTVVQYLRRKRRARFRRALGELERIEIFKDLSQHDIEDLASAVVHESFEAGSTIYSVGDPSEYLYFLEKGQVILADPQTDDRSPEVLSAGSSFGRMAFVTGAPHARNALANRACRVWMLPREAFDRAMEVSEPLSAAVRRMIATEDVDRYLTVRHGLEQDQVDHWREAALASARGGGVVPNAVAIERRRDQFVRISDGIRRVPIFRGLSRDDLRAVADTLFYVRFERGDSIFRRHEPADRLYIVDTGAVALVDPLDPLGRRKIIEDGEVFGARSFLTGARRAASAIATDDCALWVLRKPDFDRLLHRVPNLLEKVKEYLEDDPISDYLARKQGLEPQRIARWIRTATRNVDSGRLIPSVADMARDVGQHGGAPIAIWLGIMLDGVPESLVIGSSMVNAHVSLSLIVGLFLSNYPEALSSSVGMRQQGMGFARVLVMWTSLMVVTGIGAMLGSMFFINADPWAFALVEGIAAGAMLTMIAQTMAPEAYLKGGSAVGLSTLAGFLTAIFFKTLE